MKECCEKLKACAPLFLRIGLGVIFFYHGFGKVFGEGTGLGLTWNSHQMPGVVQALVAWGELLSGIGILLGIFTELASLAIIIIMLGAIYLVHWKNGFNMMNGGFEYNFAIIMMCLTLIGIGPGSCRIGGCGCKKE